MRSEVDFLLKLRGRASFVQILDYKYFEIEDDYSDSEDDENAPKKKFLKCYILMEEIKGVSLRDLYENKLKKMETNEE